jgi:hypothetical protein
LAAASLAEEHAMRNCGAARTYRLTSGAMFLPLRLILWRRCSDGDGLLGARSEEGERECGRMEVMRSSDGWKQDQCRVARAPITWGSAELAAEVDRDSRGQMQANARGETAHIRAEKKAWPLRTQCRGCNATCCASNFPRSPQAPISARAARTQLQRMSAPESMQALSPKLQTVPIPLRAAHPSTSSPRITAVVAHAPTESVAEHTRGRW